MNNNTGPNDERSVEERADENEVIDLRDVEPTAVMDHESYGVDES